jgi:hypothetical protein
MMRNHILLDLIHSRLDLIHSRLDLTHTQLDLIHISAFVSLWALGSIKNYRSLLDVGFVFELQKKKVDK